MGEEAKVEKKEEAKVEKKEEKKVEKKEEALKTPATVSAVVHDAEQKKEEKKVEKKEEKKVEKKEGKPTSSSVAEKLKKLATEEPKKIEVSAVAHDAEQKEEEKKVEKKEEK